MTYGDGGVPSLEKVTYGDGGTASLKKVTCGDGGIPSVYIYRKGTGGPIIYWGTFLYQENTIEHLIDSLEKEIGEKEYILVAVLPENWNRDFSPWKAPAAFGNEDFGGEGPDLLRWLQEDLEPAISELYGNERNRYLVGYSLAGLFALWAAYEMDLFDGIACCSGSLWFRDWDRYTADRKVLRPCRVYLSLGGKEEKTKNQQMAMVGDRTRMQEKLLLKDPNVIDSVLEWNSGGHFADSGKRLAKGIRWLLEAE